MPRTTLNIDKSVLDELKERARREGIPLGDLITSLLCRGLEAERRADESEPFEWYSRDLGQPAIDTRNWSAFMERIYAEDDLRRGIRR
jgi:hypothetical protein